MKCPSCQTELEKIDENIYLCKPCDLHFQLSKGKPTIEKENKTPGRLQVIEEDLAYTKEKLARLEKSLLGDDGELF